MPIPATATPSMWAAPYANTNGQGWRACTLRIRSGQRSAAIWRGSRSSRWRRWCRKCAPPSTRGRTPILSSSRARMPTPSTGWKTLAGADVIFIEAPRSLEELQAVARAFPDVPLLFNWADSGKTPPLSLDEIRALGFKLVIFPVSLLFAATYAMLQLLEVFKQGQTPVPFREHMLSFSQFTDQIGLPQIQALERRYGVNQ